MAPVNWDAFEGLPGAAHFNFEMLCRALIRRHYGRYGAFAALAAQPGVEFHLKLHTRCSLGDPDRWYGWQCRWYGVPGGRAIGVVRRRGIESAIRTSENELPDLTDWVLWMRRPLTEGDQDWFYRLPTHMRLHLWTAAEVEEHLTGEAEILRRTFFGELVLTPDILANLHKVAVAPIRRRWQPEVHQTIDAERALRRMLGETDTWDDLRRLAGQLESDAEAVGDDLTDVPGSFADATAEVVRLARELSTALTDAYAALERGDLDLMRQRLACRPAPPDPELVALPRQLRARRHHAGLTVTNVLADARLAHKLLDEVRAHLATRLISVLADAGCGKTQLAAQITAAASDRPAGILLHGRDLHEGHSLDDLAHRVSVQGSPVPTMEALVAAVDAAGQRAHRRLPIVIDGLNEAEDPRAWNGQLASLRETLRQYPHVLVLCTLRTAFAAEAVPPDVSRLEITGFNHDTMEAVRRYFEYYRIDPADGELPWRLLSHPLTLRLFCEVTNQTRRQVVGIEAMPGSLTALFDRYLEQAAERIVDLAPPTMRYYVQDIRAALHEIGVALWEEKARSLDLGALRRRLGDDGRPWNESIVRALEQDGVLLRDPGDLSAAARVAVVYDPLGGHLVADAILALHGNAGLRKWLRDPATVAALDGGVATFDRLLEKLRANLTRMRLRSMWLPRVHPRRRAQHPLAPDIFRGLVGLVPRRLHRMQLWPLVEEPLRTAALRDAADLEGSYLDAATVSELAALAAEPSSGPRDLFDRLWDTRGAPAHPLNAEFCDAILRRMSVASRDLRWTEWIRHREEDVRDDLRWLEQRWRRGLRRRTLPDRLRARWVMWTLTSTVLELRDQATRSLYWFGRGDPAALFELTLDALAINDPYVSERLLATSYGVAMAHQLSEPAFARELRSYLTGLRDALAGPSATHPTSHSLARLYAQGSLALAVAYHKDAVPDGIGVEGRLLFAPGPAVEPIASEDPRGREVGRAIRMDFENYTIGRLFDDRGNYDMTHPGHLAAVAYVRGTIWALGWREDGLGAIDKDLNSYSFRGNRPLTERYGKKYGWIGFHTYAGMLADEGRLAANERLSDLHIDPSFPEAPSSAPIDIPIWADATVSTDRLWIRRGVVTVPDEFLHAPVIASQPGPWVAVHAYLDTRDQGPGRKVFGVLVALLVATKDADRLVDALSTSNRSSRWRLPEVPSDYYTFAGEIPWSEEFARTAVGEPVAELYRGTVQVDDSPIEVEILAHRYAWESYHSALNEAGGALAPSRLFSAAFDLRGIPQSFGQSLPDGSDAALSLAAPAGFDGHVLFLREDLVREYAVGRQMVWFLWGERQLYPYPDPAPEWLSKARRKGEDLWTLIRRGEELSRTLAPRAPRGARRLVAKRGSEAHMRVRPRRSSS